MRLKPRRVGRELLKSLASVPVPQTGERLAEAKRPFNRRERRKARQRGYI